MAKIAKQIHPAKKLGLQKRILPHSIVEVVNTLQKAGFAAYIVGGGVRDGLLGIVPKDFDAVTDARPHEIKAVFGSRCRIIGRRFLLAHVYSGREMIEVATFRAPPKDDKHTTEEGMITRDNAWGSIEEDFARRDFSINALYYDPIKDEVVDFCEAIGDIKNRTLRLLGNAKVRIEEDPVRLLRALRFKAKLGFDFDKNLSKQFHEKNWALLEQVSAHRLYDETQKMFSGGYLAPLLPLLFEYGAMSNLMPHAPNTPTALMSFVASNTDTRVVGGRSVNPAYFYATLLWGNYLYLLDKFKKKYNFYDAQTKAMSRTFDQQRQYTAIPKFAEDFIRDVWLMQPKLTAPRPSDILKLPIHPRFRAAYDFLLAREQADDHPLSESTNSMGVWWTQFLVFDSKARQEMIDTLGTQGARRRKGKSFSQEHAEELAQILQLSLSEENKDNTPKPLFDAPNAKLTQPKKHTQSVPVFAKVAYTQADFQKLLDNDEPYIPSVRYRRRQPSSSLSIKEREQGLTEDRQASSVSNADGFAAKAPSKLGIKPSSKSASKRRSKVDAKEQDSLQNTKPKRKRKSNAKPKADAQ